MRKAPLIITASIITVGVIFFSSKLLNAQPHAKKICFYPKAGMMGTKLKDLNPKESACIEDSITLKAFNSAKQPLGMVVGQGGFYGTYVDEKNKTHLIFIGPNGVISDYMTKKTYVIEDEKFLQIWDAAKQKAIRKVFDGE